VSDDVPDCCDCRLERFSIQGWTDEPAIPHGGNLGDEPAGGRPLQYFWHGDWCKHRPTKALVSVAHYSVSPNDTVRVFVEGASDFSKYVWAELQYEAAVPFPDRDDRFHTASGTPTAGGSYPIQFNFFGRGPAFGIANGQHVPQFRSLEDPDDYLKSPWPVYIPIYATQGIGFLSAPSVVWIGTRLRVRWGYRENNSDTVLGSIVFPENYSSGFNWFGQFSQLPFVPRGGLGTLAIGCNWDDIRFPNDSDNVRCGVELLQLGFFGYHGYFQNIANFGTFTIPFELPRAFFADTQSNIQPTPPLQHRLVGLEAVAPKVTVPTLHLGEDLGLVPIPGFTYGDSTNLDIESFESVVTCGARRSAIFIPPSLQSETGILPAGPVGPATPPADGIIRADAPLFVRRDDLNERSYNSVANADSWHATHLVRAGSPLAIRNALHNLNLEFEPCEFPGGLRSFVADYTSPGPMRAGLLAVAGSNFLTSTGFDGVVTFGGTTPGTQFFFVFPEDVDEPNDEASFPPAWIWDALSGGVSLAPFAATEERMAPNSYHAMFDEPLVTSTASIVTPQGYTGAGQATQIDPRANLVFPLVMGSPLNQDAEFAAYDAVQVPARVRDYRGEWTIESFPQIWATTRLAEEWQRVGPRDISLQDSGMTTENHDGYSGGGYRLDYVPESAGAVIRVFGRAGIKINLTRVQGFRRVRERQQSGNNVFFSETSDVAVYGDYEANDVACHEELFDFEIALNGGEVESISAGQTVTKQVRAGYYQVEPDESGNPVFEDVFRTVHISVSSADTP
jgi:hypothetical protein